MAAATAEEAEEGVDEEEQVSPALVSGDVGEGRVPSMIFLVMMTERK